MNYGATPLSVCTSECNVRQRDSTNGSSLIKVCSTDRTIAWDHRNKFPFNRSCLDSVGAGMAYLCLVSTFPWCIKSKYQMLLFTKWGIHFVWSTNNRPKVNWSIPSLIRPRWEPALWSMLWNFIWGNYQNVRFSPERNFS